MQLDALVMVDLVHRKLSACTMESRICVDHRRGTLIINFNDLDRRYTGVVTCVHQKFLPLTSVILTVGTPHPAPDVVSTRCRVCMVSYQVEEWDEEVGQD